MTALHRRKPRPALDSQSLAALALHYVERYATTRAKLAGYLYRKIRERGWEGLAEPDVESIVERFADSGYVDDGAYALAKSRSLSARGYGAGRLRQSLRQAGVEERDSAAARSLAEEQAADSALRFARRRRIGPFAADRPDCKGRQKALAAMLRAGHGFDLARAIVDLAPGANIDPEMLVGKGSDRPEESV
jgi:regulatory protein